MLVAGVWWFAVKRSEAKSTEPAVSFSMGGGKEIKIDHNPTASQMDEIQKMMNESMARRMKDYAAMTPEEKKKHLDEEIDKVEQMRKNGHFLATTQPTTQAAPEDGKTKVEVQGTPTDRKVTIRVGGKAGDKSMMENVPPEIRALIAQYQADMKARRAERGLPDLGGGMILINQRIETKK